MRRHPHLFLGLPRGVFETFWVFRGAFWQSDRRGGRHSLHYALAHPTKMAEAWRRERAIVRLYDHPDDGNECSAIIVRIDEEGVRVRVKDLLTGSSSAGMRSSEIVVREDQLGPLAPPQGDINPPEKPADIVFGLLRQTCLPLLAGRERGSRSCACDPDNRGPISGREEATQQLHENNRGGEGCQG